MAEIVVLAGRYKAHHFRPLEERFAGRYVYEESYDPGAILAHKPLLLVVFDEHYCELATAVSSARSQGVLTLQVMDGILEWRRTWEYRRDGRPVDGRALPLNQPVLSDKIACLGRRDARILESWGNLGKCEIIGAPRMDSLLKDRLARIAQPVRPENRPPRVLVMTAKTAGFTEEQVRTNTAALVDLRDYFTGRSDIDVIWRLTQGLDKSLGVHNALVDLTGLELASVLKQVDAVITTPSTSMLEAMLLGTPVALLDYHNTPHYFEAAWTISCSSHVAPIVSQLLAPSPERAAYQEYLLQEQLACVTPASDRLAALIERMLNERRKAATGECKLPSRIIDGEDLFVTSELPVGELLGLYPHLSQPKERTIRELRLSLIAAHASVEVLHQRIRHLEGRLERIPGYSLARAVRKKFWR